MKTKHVMPALLAIAALIGACSSMPKTTSLLEQTRSDYVQAQNNPKIASYAALEMKQAGYAMEQANEAARKDNSDAKIDQLAYLAKQKIALTQEVAKQKSAEAEVGNTAKERDQLRLDQRTMEADRATTRATQSALAAQLALGEAADSQRRAQEAEKQAADAQGKTQMAADETAEAQRRTQEAEARAAQLEAQLADLAAKKTERGIVITLGDVLFAIDQASLNADGMRIAQKLAVVLRDNPQRTVMVEGFTDSTGSAQHNQELSERRATAVRGALLGMGVARERVAVRGFGESFPVVGNDTASSRQLNRRVEIVLSDASGKIAQR